MAFTEQRAYIPEVSSCVFFSEDRGREYAVGAGFDVAEGSPAIASREDMPGISFRLEKFGDGGLVWVRQ